jgi:hypothetical protein
MQNNSSPTSVVLNPNTPSPGLILFLPAHVRRKIAARWREWEPSVWIYLRRRHYDSTVVCKELARLRQRHMEHVVDLMGVGIEMRVVRRHGLDDPRLTDEARSVLVQAAMERQRKAWLARHRALGEEQRTSVGLDRFP